MAFQQWHTGSDTELPPWASDYVKECPEDIGRTYDVRDVKMRPKGLIIETNVFAAWVFKSKTLHGFVLEFIEKWYKAKGGSPIMQLMLTNSEPYWVIGVDDERKGGWGKGADQPYWHQHYMSAEDNPDWGTNPLPLPPTLPRVPTGTNGQSATEDSLRSAEDYPTMRADWRTGEPVTPVDPLKQTKTRKARVDPS